MKTIYYSDDNQTVLNIVELLESHDIAVFVHDKSMYFGAGIGNAFIVDVVDDDYEKALKILKDRESDVTNHISSSSSMSKGWAWTLLIIFLGIIVTQFLYSTQLHYDFIQNCFSTWHSWKYKGI